MSTLYCVTHFCIVTMLDRDSVIGLGSFTNCVISRGRVGFQIITLFCYPEGLAVTLSERSLLNGT